MELYDELLNTEDDKTMVEQIKIVDEVNIRYDSVSKGCYVEITPSYKNSFESISTGIIKNKKEAIYMAVTMFVKWYNLNTKKKSWTKKK